MKVDDADIPTVRRLAEAKERRSSHRADCCKAIAPKLAKLGESVNGKSCKTVAPEETGAFVFFKSPMQPTE